MSVDWSLLAPKDTALDPVTSLHYGAADNAQRANVQLLQQEAARKDAEFKAKQASAQAAQGHYQRASELYNTGDTRGAQAEFMAAGSPELVNATTSGSKEVFDQHNTGLQAIGGFAKYVMEHVGDPAAMKSVIAHNKPLLVAAGAHPEDVDAILNTPDEQMHDALGGVVNQFYSPKDQDAAKVAQQNADTSATNAQTSRMTEVRQAETPIAIDPDKNVYLPGGVAAGGAPAGDPSLNNTRAARNNNPGNLRWDGKSKWQGMTGVDDKGFVIFDTPSNGDRALSVNLINQQRLHGINTIGALISKFAPASDNNATASYAATVARALGVSPNTPINLQDPNVLRTVKAAITGVESGGIPAKFANVNGPRMIAQGTPKDDGSAIGGNPNLSGDAYLASLPADRRAMVKAIADGRAAPPNSRSKAGEQLLAQVTQYDPTFDASNAASRQKTRISYTSGQMSQNKTALNTAMGHLIHLDEQAQHLGNFSVLPGIINPAYNAARDTLGDTRLGAFDQTKQAAASEMRKVFAGTGGGSLAELEAWEAQLSSAKSPAQLHQVIKNGVILMSSRLDAVRQQYADGMGRSNQTPRFVTDGNLRTVKSRFGIQLNDGRTSASRPTNRNTGAPAVGSIVKGYRFNGGDPANPSSWTKVR